MSKCKSFDISLVKIFYCTSFFKPAILISFIGFSGLVACSGTETLQEQEPDNRSQELSELEALHWARIDSSRMNFTDADIRFMTDMIAHHAQALIMSRMAPENGASPAVQRLAARIINAQDGEIATMQKWLRDRGQPVPLVHIEGLNLMIHREDAPDAVPEDHEGHMAMDHSTMDHGDMDHSGMTMSDGMGHDHHDMPGMLTQEQLVELSEARNSHFDRLFLTYMIDHHLGAVIMVDELFAADGAANDLESFELASEINAEQRTEIDRMKLMLENMTN